MLEVIDPHGAGGGGGEEKKAAIPNSFSLELHRDDWRQGRAEAAKAGGAGRSPVSHQQKCTWNHGLKMPRHCSGSEQQPLNMHK